MQAIEFETVVRDQVIPLPEPGVVSPGQPVRVVVMFEQKAVASSSAKPDAISVLCADPLVAPDFLPLSREEAHER